MKMIFPYNEMVCVTGMTYSKREILYSRKNDIAKFLISSKDLMESQIILTYLPIITKIELCANDYIELYPLRVRMLVDESITEFLRRE